MKALSKSGRQNANHSRTAGKTLKRFSIVQKIFLLALVAQICVAGSLKAQTWLTYGNGQDGNLTVIVVINQYIRMM